MFCAASLDARAQETEAAVSSVLIGISLPGGARRVTRDTVPAEVKQTFDKIAVQTGTKLLQGEQEVLMWGDAIFPKLWLKLRSIV
jgi:hypothetical protein